MTAIDINCVVFDFVSKSTFCRQLFNKEYSTLTPVHVDGTLVAEMLCAVRLSRVASSSLCAVIVVVVITSRSRSYFQRQQRSAAVTEKTRDAPHRLNLSRVNSTTILCHFCCLFRDL